MPNYRRAYQNGGTYFFTVVTYERYPLFLEDEGVKLLMDCFERTMQDHPFAIDALVILPDHLHSVWTLPEDDCDFSTRWNLIKGNFSRRHGVLPAEVSESRLRRREKGIWQRRFWEHVIRDQDDFNRHCDYIHYNPVKHGLVRAPSDWRHSTFANFVGKGWYSQSWGETAPKNITKMNLE